MELKSNSWYVKYYINWYGLYDKHDLPQSLCSFFWKMLISLLLFPITYPSNIVNLFINNKCEKFNAFSGFAIHMIGLFFGVLFCVVINHHNIGPGFFLYGPLIGWLVIAFCGLFIYIGFLIGDIAIKYIIRIYPKNYTRKQSNNWFTEGIKAFFGKYCPRINWK